MGGGQPWLLPKTRYQAAGGATLPQRTPISEGGSQGPEFARGLTGKLVGDPRQLGGARGQLPLPCPPRGPTHYCVVMAQGLWAESPPPGRLTQALDQSCPTSGAEAPGPPQGDTWVFAHLDPNPSATQIPTCPERQR